MVETKVVEHHSLSMAKFVPTLVLTYLSLKMQNTDLNVAHKASLVYINE